MLSAAGDGTVVVVGGVLVGTEMEGGVGADARVGMDGATRTPRAMTRATPRAA